MASEQDYIAVTDSDELARILQAHKGVLVLYGGPMCGVCQVIKPKILAELKQHFAELVAVYVDCQGHSEVCAQRSVFTLPVVQVYFENQLFVEKARSFSLASLINEMQRPYQIVFSES